MKYLLDSDFLFGLFVLKDPHHEKTKRVFKEIVESKESIFVLNLVIQETSTVLSRKINQKTALLFLERLSLLPIKIIRVDEELEAKAWNLFRGQTKKRISFIDCANLVSYESYKLDGILSFGDFYPENKRLK